MVARTTRPAHCRTSESAAKVSCVTTDADFWDRLARSAEMISTTPASEDKKESGTEPGDQVKDKRKRRRKLVLLDAVSLLAWANWPAVIFFTNLPERAFGSLADYRFFFYLAALVVGSCFFTTVCSLSLATSLPSH